jgi:hypothetical protein
MGCSMAVRYRFVDFYVLGVMPAVWLSSAILAGLVLLPWRFGFAGLLCSSVYPDYLLTSGR